MAVSLRSTRGAAKSGSPEGFRRPDATPHVDPGIRLQELFVFWADDAGEFGSGAGQPVAPSHSFAPTAAWQTRGRLAPIAPSILSISLCRRRIVLARPWGTSSASSLVPE